MKRAWLNWLVGTVLAAIAIAAPAHASLLAYYTFEGNANDVSGNGFNGTFSPTAPTLTAAGYQGAAYQFGTGGANTYISIPLNINPAARPQVTFGAWVNADVADAVIRGVISHDTGDFDRTLDVDTRGGGVQWCMFLGLGPNGACGGPVVPGSWTFLAARYDAAAGTAALSVDGTNFGPFGANPGSGEVFTLIGRNPNFDFPFIGRIDNVFFFDTYLSDAEIQNIRVNGIPEPSSVALLGLAILALLWARGRFAPARRGR